MNGKGNAPLDLRGLCVLFILALLAAAPLRAAEPQAPQVPVLFDARERLPRPDLSTLIRLRFLTATDFPPFNFLDQTGRLGGFNVDLVRALCAELKVEAKCQIQALPYADLLASLDAGQGEAVIAGIGVNAELRRRYQFSRPYLFLPARFVRNRARPLVGEAPAALSGQPVGVVGETAHAAMLRRFFPAVKPVAFADRAAMLEALERGDVDAVFADSLQLSFWANGPASRGCCALFGGPYFSEHFLGEGMTVTFRHHDSQLAAAIDSGLAAIARDGRMQEIYLRYFPYGLY